jgi:hypothetical protein
MPARNLRQGDCCRPFDGSDLGTSPCGRASHGCICIGALRAFLWLDGWGIPWYSRSFKIVTQKWLANLLPFAERSPWGVKDPRIRARVEQAIKSGDSSRAGIAGFRAV